MKLVSIKGLSLAIAGSLVLLSSISHSMTPAATPLSTQCWSYNRIPCLDCPEAWTYSCNPWAEGVFVYCNEFLVECAEPNKVCQQIETRTGLDCPQ